MNKIDTLIKISSIEPEKVKYLISKIIEMTNDKYIVKETTATNEFIEQEAASITQLISELYNVKDKKSIEETIKECMWNEEMQLCPLDYAIEKLKEKELL